MMKINQKKIEAFCNTILAITPECIMIISKDGLSTQAVDAANVALVSVNLPKGQFEQFGEKGGEVGMNTTKWKDYLGIMKDPASTITIETDPVSGRFSFTDGTKNFNHTPLAVSVIRKRPNMPNLNLPAHIVIDAKEFKEAMGHMGVIGDKVTLSIEGETLVISVEGDTDELRQVVKRKDCGDNAKNPCEGPVSALFSLDYLKECAKAMKDAKEISVNLQINHPVRFDFEIEGVEASFLVAPRIEQEGTA